MAEHLHKLAQTMCSVDLADSNWTQELPRLPVPDLWLTVSRYLASLKAVLAPNDQLASEEASDTGYSREQWAAMQRQYKRTDLLVRQFMLNEGPELQRDLKEYANKCQNWATEYWLQDMYLANPLPLPVNSNPFFLFPRQHFATSEAMLMFATRIIQFSVDFKYRIDQQALKQDFGSGHGKGKPLCMETYKNFFHSYRMPHEDSDRLLPQSRRSNHIVVASCNQFYILRLGQDPLDDPYRQDASLMNEMSIYEQLLKIYRVSRERAKRDLMARNQAASSVPSLSPRQLITRIPKVGLFTTENRKVWAKLHKRLSHCAVTGNSTATPGGSQHLNTNVESLRQIEDCLFVMCLDSLVTATPPSGGAQSPRATPSPISELEEVVKEKAGDEGGEVDVGAANLILTGGGTEYFTANRWFDKFLQIIVGRNGVCGVNIEHSVSEGITVLRFLEDFLEFIRRNPVPASANHFSQQQQQSRCSNEFNYPTNRKDQLDGTARSGAGDDPKRPSLGKTPASGSITSPAYVEPESPSVLLNESDKITPLKWSLDQYLLRALDEAEVKANKLINSYSLYILTFRKFGRTFIKNQNLSPDAFIQLALQYTFFKEHGFLVSTYESASLRQFRLGRVDNIRANTSEAYDWIKAMLACRRMPGATETNENTNNDGSTNRRLTRWRPAEGPFIRAVTKQVEILRYTITGGGPDNHLLALKQLAHIRYDSESLPELFTDPSYKEFLNFRLSTSQLPNESGITVGYGAVVQDGYGCSYNPCHDRIVFCVSTFVDCHQCSSEKFSSTLEESLLEMQELCLARGIKNGKE